MKRNHKARKEGRSAFWDAVLFFFFPPMCAVCHRVGFDDLCPDCREELDAVFDPKSYRTRGGTGFADAMMTLFPYENASVKPLLFDWKMEDYEDLHRIFGGYMKQAAEKGLFPEVDLITYCPRRRQGILEHGQDQAQLIAEELSKQLGIPCRTLLSRRGFSLPQHKTHGEMRERNVRGVFEATETLQGESILLVDDIVTTGSSVREAARILKKSGAMKVFVFSLAH